MIPRSQNVFFGRYTPGWAFVESRDLVFSPSRSNLGLVSSRLAGLVHNREIYNLSMVSGLVLLKIRGNTWIFIFLGPTQTNTTKTKTQRKGRNRSSVDLRSSRVYQNDRERWRGYFREVGPEQLKKHEKSKTFPESPHVFLDLAQNPVNPRCINRLDPILDTHSTESSWLPVPCGAS